MMPEDIPEAPARLTEDDALRRASDWTDFRRDYASHDDATRSREYAAFCAGWDARHLDPTLTPAQEAAIERVRHMIEANSHVTASITEALYTDATERADADALAGLSDRRRADVEAVREKIAEPLPRKDHEWEHEGGFTVEWWQIEPKRFEYRIPGTRMIVREEDVKGYGACYSYHCGACDEKPAAAWEYSGHPAQVGANRRLGDAWEHWQEKHGAEPLPEHDHRPIQHRDGREPWCPTCGLNADYNVPHSRFTSRREAREAALRERGKALAAAAGAGQVSAADLTRAAHIAAGGNPDDLLASGGGLRRPIRDEPQA